MNKELTEGDDYYFDKYGFIVFTESYLLARGTCCGNGCRHCPYNYINVPETERVKLQFDKIDKSSKNIN